MYHGIRFDDIEEEDVTLDIRLQEGDFAEG